MLLLSLSVSICLIAIILAAALPMLARRRRTAERLGRVIMDEREVGRIEQEKRLKAQERQTRHKSQARNDAMRAWLERFRLENMIASPELRLKLAAAGWRRKSAAVGFVFLRFSSLLGATAIAALYSLSPRLDIPPFAQVAIIVLAGALGFYLPNLIVKNKAQKRQQAILKSFPDALDLLVICVESGISIEAAINRVADEIADSAPVLSEELSILNAELMFLGDRRQAYTNFTERTGIAPARTFATTLTQSERYGTPVGVALKVLSQENRKERLSRAEQKAGALPAKLTIPMIVCFLPGVLVVILAPTALRMMAQ